uniref:Uncharacterized protein n=1 Tax=Rhizophora mucronata TaxID=61149 RepID=A0A2P2J3A8_RHIMU
MSNHNVLVFPIGIYLTAHSTV